MQGTEAASGAPFAAALRTGADDGHDGVQWAARAPGAWQRAATPSTPVGKRGLCAPAGSKSKAACFEFYDRSRRILGGGGTHHTAPTLDLAKAPPAIGTGARASPPRAGRRRSAPAATSGTSEAH